MTEHQEHVAKAVSKFSTDHVCDEFTDLAKKLQADGLNKADIARGIAASLLTISLDLWREEDDLSVMQEVAYVFCDQATMIEDVMDTVARNMKEGGDGQNYDN